MLNDLEARSVTLSDISFANPALYLGRGDSAVEIIVATTKAKPERAKLEAAWKLRKGGRASPVVLVAVQDEVCSLAASLANDPTTIFGVPVLQVERLCRALLAQPDRHAALRLLATAISAIQSPAPGLRNEGLFATHELLNGVPRRHDWAAANERASTLLHQRGQELARALGFEVRPLPGAASMLVTEKGAQVAVAVFLDEREVAEIASERFGNLSPVMYALAKADEVQVRYAVISSGAALRLYTVQPGAGVGYRGRTETFAEIQLDLLRQDQAAYLWLLFSHAALSAAGTVAQILDDSRRYATELGVRLRDRIYSDVVPRLAEAIFKARRLKDPTPAQLAETYRMALLVLFRLLFIAYAEDQDLLPFETNASYRRRALKTKARELIERPGDDDGPSLGTLWEEIKVLFRAIDQGKREWGIPTYNGGLFSDDPAVSPIGATLAKLNLPEDLFSRAFELLMLDHSFLESDPQARGPVDFRSLGVRDFGTIYEGLLESELSIAEVDLALDRNDKYRPASENEEPVVRAGAAYLGTPSGVRKSTGTYYTKTFAVEHLLDHALEPALARHLRLLDDLDEAAASEAFFDFRVTDVSMGSGHFLVAAVDRIERQLSNYLSKRPMAGVIDELARLRKRAVEALGSEAEHLDIDNAQLLRRQIARRCIYGVDLNPDPVALARLSLWVHTFVPGLPLSVLDHHLVQGNSLVGIGTHDEALELADNLGMPLFRRQIDKIVDSAREAAMQLAKISEADAAEVKQAREMIARARKAVEPAMALFDILAATRFGGELEAAFSSALHIWKDDPSKLRKSKPHKAALAAFAPLRPFHFPLMFPEVFLREMSAPGFDVILGNPPWEEATLEEDDFWTRWDPGYQGLPQHERERRRTLYRKSYPERVAMFEEEKARAEALRRSLTSGGFPGMGTGDPDMYKAFAWRFWNLCAKDSGRIGVVLPRSAFAAKGSTEWRRRLLTDGIIDDMTMLVNNGGWVFDDVHQQYTIALASFHHPETQGLATDGDHIIPFHGPFSSATRFEAGARKPAVPLPVRALLDGSDSAALPLLPSEESAEIWLQMRRAPRLDLNDGRSWRTRPFRELDATNDKKLKNGRVLMHFKEECPDGFWPVFKGESFDIWSSDTKGYYAWANPEVAQRLLQERRVEAHGRANSPFAEMSADWCRDPKTLPCLRPRITFRDVSRATDSRTVRAALIPPKVVITNTAPYLLWPRGDQQDEAFLLGVLSSIPLDWFARRHVETHLNYFIFNPLPIPRPARTDALWQRVVALSGRLAAQDRRFSSWAKKVGVKCGKLDADEQEDMVAELDAVVAHLYGLKEAQVRHVFETFHEGWDYEGRLNTVIEHYTRWGAKL